MAWLGPVWRLTIPCFCGNTFEVSANARLASCPSCSHHFRIEALPELGVEVGTFELFNDVSAGA